MVAEALEHKAEESFFAAISDFHACKAAYRLFANPKLRPEKISEPHIQRSLGRARESSENLLIVHDTTELKNLVGVNKKYCLEDKASFRWIEHLNSCHAMLSPVGKEVIHVADRESDIYEFLQTADELDAKYVVRSMANRRITTGAGTKDTSTLDAKLLSTESLGTTTLEISDENGRVQLHHMLVKAVQVSLFCPQGNVQSQKVGALKPLRVWIV